MKYNEFGQFIATCDDLCELLYIDPNVDLSKFLVEDSAMFNNSVDSTYSNLTKLSPLVTINKTLEEFDKQQQSNWHMPIEYYNLNIEEWILNQCSTNIEIDRVKLELALFQERNLYTLLKYLKYMVDIFRKNNIVWGVGRGSSVASYVLYLIGIHKINSIQYNLDIKEFLK